MRIRGNIRRGPGGVDVAFVHDEKWHNIHGPLLTNIELLYNFLMSPEERAQLFGRIYTKKHRVYDDNPSTSVSFRGGLCDLVLTRYEKTRDGRPSPSDRATVELIFQSTSPDDPQFVDQSEGGGY